MRIRNRHLVRCWLVLCVLAPLISSLGEVYFIREWKHATYGVAIRIPYWSNNDLYQKFTENVAFQSVTFPYTGNVPITGWPAIMMCPLVQPSQHFRPSCNSAGDGYMGYCGPSCSYWAREVGNPIGWFNTPYPSASHTVTNWVSYSLYKCMRCANISESSLSGITYVPYDRICDSANVPAWVFDYGSPINVNGVAYSPDGNQITGAAWAPDNTKAPDGAIVTGANANGRWEWDQYTPPHWVWNPGQQPVVADNWTTLNNTGQSVADGVNSVNGSVQALNTTAHTINNTVNNVNNSVQTMNSTVQNVYNSVNNVDNSVRNVDNSVQTVNTSVQTVNNTVNNMNTSVQNVNSSVQNLNSTVNNVDSSIHNVDNSVQTVNNTVSTVNNSVNNLNTTIANQYETWNQTWNQYENSQNTWLADILASGGNILTALNTLNSTVANSGGTSGAGIPAATQTDIANTANNTDLSNTKLEAIRSEVAGFRAEASAASAQVNSVLDTVSQDVAGLRGDLAQMGGEIDDSDAVEPVGGYPDLAAIDAEAKARGQTALDKFSALIEEMNGDGKAKIGKVKTMHNMLVGSWESLSKTPIPDVKKTFTVRGSTLTFDVEFSKADFITAKMRAIEVIMLWLYFVYRVMGLVSAVAGVNKGES